MRPNTLGAYTPVPHFAYPGWRLRLPGGPAGGQYHGFPANYIAGTALDAQDPFEADRAAGAASYDAVHAHPSNPRGVYRGPAEVPPAPNAGTSLYRTYRSWQTQRHPGTSEAPGSFPAPFVETPEDFVASDQTWPAGLEGPRYPRSNIVRMPEPADFASASPRVENWVIPPASPRPAPTVGASPSDFLPAFSIPPWGIETGPGGTRIGVGQPVSSFADWMEQDTIWRGVKNKWVGLGVIGLIAWGRRG